MTDTLIERLREPYSAAADPFVWLEDQEALSKEAADEIERLRTKAGREKFHNAEIERLTGELSEARVEIVRLLHRPELADH